MSRRPPFVALAVVFPALALHLTPPTADALAFDREAILGGEFWRLFTGNWIHWSFSHLFWNVALIAAVGIPLERDARRQLTLAIVGGTLLIGPTLFVLEPEMARYAGLSGLAAAGLTTLIIRNLSSGKEPRALWAAAALLLGAKIAVELVDPTPMLAGAGSSTFQSVPLAHLVGVLAGIGAAFHDPVRPSRTTFAVPDFRADRSSPVNADTRRVSAARRPASHS